MAVAPGRVERSFAIGVKDVNAVLEGVDVAEENPIPAGEARFEELEGAANRRSEKTEGTLGGQRGLRPGSALPLAFAMPLASTLPFGVLPLGVHPSTTSSVGESCVTFATLGTFPTF